MQLDILTIFPKIFDGFLTETLIARGQKKKIIKINVQNLRNYANDRRKTVDYKPFGGGPGMVFKASPVYRAVKKLVKTHVLTSRGLKYSRGTKVVLLSAKGKLFTQTMAKKWSKLDHLVLICGRYEGVDERVAKYIATEEVSIGPYVLNGGEVASMVIVEAIARLLPDFLGKKESLLEESYSRVKEWESENGNLKLSKEYPHYTRPEIFSPDGKIKWAVPKILLSGNHKKIEEWRNKHRK